MISFESTSANHADAILAGLEVWAPFSTLCERDVLWEALGGSMCSGIISKCWHL